MDFENMMKELRAEYLAELPDKISAIESTLSREDQQELRNHFHKLKGTGKTYGLPEVSSLGEVVERVCLEQPDKLKRVVPLALAILQEIHQTRLAEKPFEIQADNRFMEIKASLAPTS